jgi:hypothetical protein
MKTRRHAVTCLRGVTLAVAVSLAPAARPASSNAVPLTYSVSSMLGNFTRGTSCNGSPTLF